MISHKSITRLSERELQDLEAKAKAASPGPWWHNDFPAVYDADHRFVCDMMVARKKRRMADADYITAANPKAILKLIAEVHEYREAK